MKIEVLARTNQRLREQPLWALLAADHGPLVLALLEVHLLEKDRTLASSVLAERLHEDLRRLRVGGFDLQQPPEKLLGQWLNAGYLIRRLRAGAVEEEYEYVEFMAREKDEAGATVEVYRSAPESPAVSARS